MSIENARTESFILRVCKRWRIRIFYLLDRCHPLLSSVPKSLVLRWVRQKHYLFIEKPILLLKLVKEFSKLVVNTPTIKLCWDSLCLGGFSKTKNTIIRLEKKNNQSMKWPCARYIENESFLLGLKLSESWVTFSTEKSHYTLPNIQREIIIESCYAYKGLTKKLIPTMASLSTFDPVASPRHYILPLFTMDHSCVERLIKEVNENIVTSDEDGDITFWEDDVDITVRSSTTGVSFSARFMVVKFGNTVVIKEEKIYTWKLNVISFRSLFGFLKSHPDYLSVHTTRRGLVVNYDDMFLVYGSEK